MLDPNQIRPLRPGEQITARWLNSLLSAIKQQRTTGPNVLATYFGKRVLEKPNPRAGDITSELGVLTHYRQWVDVDTTKPLYLYRYEEARINDNGIPVYTETPAETLTWNIAFHSEQQGSMPLPIWLDPKDGGTLPYSEDAQIGVDYTLGQDPGTTLEWVHFFFGTTPGGSQLGMQFGAPFPSGTTNPVFPTDGSTFYIQMFPVIGGSFNGQRTYECSITRAPTQFSLAVHLDSINWIATEAYRGPIGGHDGAAPTTEPNEWIPLDPFIVDMFPIGVDNKPEIARAFRCPDVEYWGKIVTQGPGGEPPYSDARYWVALQQMTTVGTDPYAKFTFSSRTAPGDKIVLANNLPELPTIFGESHKLPTDAIVRVRCTRGGDNPHVPRYWIETVTPAAAGVGITGAFNLVTRICFDADGCVEGYVTAEFVFTDGLLTAVNGYETPCP